MSNRTLRSVGAPLLRYPLDLIPVSVVCGTFLMSLAPLFIHLSPALWVVNALGVLILRGACAHAQHGQAHLPVFGTEVRAAPGFGPRRLLNEIYNILLSQTTGLTTAEWELQHNRGHHRHYQNPDRDVAGVFRKSRGSGPEEQPAKSLVPMTRLEYALYGGFSCWSVCLRIAREEIRDGRPNLLPRLAAQIGLQFAILSLLTHLNPPMALLFFLGPNLLVRCLVWWGTYWHHLDVPRTGVYDSSANRLGKIYNTYSFNSGHHTAHHERPTLNWSLLPSRTAEIEDRIPADCFRGKLGPAR